MSLGPRLLMLAICLAGLRCPLPAEETAASTHDLHQKVGQLLKESFELRKQGKMDEAREHQEMAAALMREHAEQFRNQRPEVRELPPRIEERRERMQRMTELSRESMELRREGKHEQADELRAEMRRLGRQLAGHPRPEPPEIALEVQIRHLHEAAENLEAAGLHDEAHALHQRANAMEDQLRRQHEVQHSPTRDVDEFQETILGTLRDLRMEVQQLRREVAQLRDELAHARHTQPTHHEPPIKKSPQPNSPENGKSKERDQRTPAKKQVPQEKKKEVEEDLFPLPAKNSDQ